MFEWFNFIVKGLISPLFFAIGSTAAAAAAPFWAFVGSLTAMISLIWMTVDIYYRLTHWNTG